MKRKAKQEALEEQQYHEEHKQDGVVIGFKFNLFPPFHWAGTGIEHDKKMKEQLDKINNSKHEFNLYKELCFENTDFNILYEGPTIKEDQDINTFDFRDRSSTLSTSKNGEANSETPSKASCSSTRRSSTGKHEFYKTADSERPIFESCEDDPDLIFSEIDASPRSIAHHWQNNQDQKRFETRKSLQFTKSIN